MMVAMNAPKKFALVTRSVVHVEEIVERDEPELQGWRQAPLSFVRQKRLTNIFTGVAHSKLLSGISDWSHLK